MISSNDKQHICVVVLKAVFFIKLMRGYYNSRIVIDMFLKTHIPDRFCSKYQDVANHYSVKHHVPFKAEPQIIYLE